jgi:hypothetical protein
MSFFLMLFCLISILMNAIFLNFFSPISLCWVSFCRMSFSYCHITEHHSGWSDYCWMSFFLMFFCQMSLSRMSFWRMSFSYCHFTDVTLHYWHFAEWHSAGCHSASPRSASLLWMSFCSTPLYWMSFCLKGILLNIHSV